MGISIKREYILENLNCANCGAKIEREVGLVEGVESSVLDFVNKRLIVELESEEAVDRVFKETWRIVKKFEPDVDVIDKSVQKHENPRLSRANMSQRNKDQNKFEAEAEAEAKAEGKDHNDSKPKSNGFLNEKNKKELIRLVLGLTLLAIALIFDFDNNLELGLYFISYLLVGSEVLMKAGKNIARGQVFDENFLMALATIGAFAIGDFPEGVSVMIFYQIGEFFQDMAVYSSRKSITELMNIKPDYANLVIGTSVQKVLPEEVLKGDFIIVKPGEKIPLDGKVVDGRSSVDTSALTGESVPRDVKPQDEILSGFINLNGLLKIEVSKEYSESTVSKILELVQNASSKKGKTENFITKFARIYTPIVVISAVLLAVVPPLIITGATFSEWIYRALIFLVVSCPCALVISIPLGFFGGIGGASKNGILIKGSNYLEALNNAATVVFDKTGTLTEGIFEVTKINTVNMKQEELLKYAAYAESFSNHPIAISIIKRYSQEIDKSLIQSIEELAGYGIMAEINHKLVYLGNSKMMEQYGFQYEKVDEIGTIVHIAVDNNYCGNIIISDRVKATSKAAIEKLSALGIHKTIMLTGDNTAVAEKISAQLGIKEVYSELLPQDKVGKIEFLENKKDSKEKLVFVGDGINDAPVLARADIGIAMGGLGSDAAIEAADIVIMNDDPEKIATAIKIARKTRTIVMQNIVFALGVKLIVMAMGVIGIATMWEAVFADVGVALIAVINSMRAMKVSE